MSAGMYVFYYPFRFYRLQYVFGQIFKSTRNPFGISLATQKAIESITTVATVIMAITAFTHSIVYLQRTSNEEQVMSFGDVLFYTSVSSITGLTSDVVPNTLFTRGVAIFIMFLGVIWIPPKMSEVLSVIEKRSPLPKSYIPEPFQKHVLVIGDLDMSSLVEFLREFFSEDHGQQIVNTKVVLMSENEPDSCVLALLNDPSYKTSVMFILGSPVSPKSLKRARVEKASSIFILSAKNISAKSEEDYKKVMVAMSVKRYLLAIDANVNIYAQTLLPETSLYLERITKHVICIPELRLGILAQGVSVPGFSSLIQSLVTSIPRNMEKQLKKIVQNNRNFYWIEEYINAIGQEIYPTKFSPFFRGMKFRDVAKYIYSNFSAILISVKPKKDKHRHGCHISSCKNILTNPANYIFKGDEVGFIISTNSYVTGEIESVPVYHSDLNMENYNGSENLISFVPAITYTRDCSDNTAGSSKHFLEPRSPTEAPQLKRAKTHSRGISFTSYFDGYNGLGKLRDITMVSTEPGEGVSGGHEAELHAEDHTKFLEPLNTRLSSFNGYSFANDSALSLYMFGDKNDRKRPSVRFEAGAVSYRYSQENQVLSESCTSFDVLPDSISDHIVICISGSTFPLNMEYLVGSIRSSAYSAHIYNEKIRNAKKRHGSSFEKLPDTQLNDSSSKKSVQTEKTLNTGAPILNQQPIVFLCSEPPAEQITRGLQRYYDVYFVTGSPFLKADLVKARIMTASSAIILMEPIPQESLGGSSDLSRLNGTATSVADASSLIAVINVETLTSNSPDFNLCVELNYRENMQFIGDSSPLEINEIYIQSLMMPCFMSGNCLIPTMLDSLICQSFYNEDLIPLLKNLIFPRGDITQEIEHSKMFAAGLSHADLPSMSNYLNEEDTSNIFLVPVPRKYIRSSFSNLFFDACSRFDAICIGLYRNSSTVTKDHNRKSQQLSLSIGSHNEIEQELHNAKYFVVNPDPQTILQYDDRVYVLAKNYPKW